MTIILAHGLKREKIDMTILQYDTKKDSHFQKSPKNEWYNLDRYFSTHPPFFTFKRQKSPFNFLRLYGTS